MSLSFTSSAINKSGKTFAPKAGARRRPPPSSHLQNPAAQPVTPSSPTQPSAAERPIVIVQDAADHSVPQHSDSSHEVARQSSVPTRDQSVADDAPADSTTLQQLEPIPTQTSPTLTTEPHANDITSTPNATSHPTRQVAGTKRKRQPKQKRKATVIDQSSINDGSSVDTTQPPNAAPRDGDTPSSHTRPRRSRRMVVESVELNPVDTPDNPRDENYIAQDQDQIPQPPVKKARKPRKSKSRQATADNDTRDGDHDDNDDELHEIDPTITTLSELTRDTARGKTSTREKRMQKIDWVEVKRRQKEGTDAATPLNGSQGATAAGDAPAHNTPGAPLPATPRETEAPTGVRLRLVNGEMVVDESSTQIDRQAQAIADAQKLRVIDDADLTTRVNRMTWVNDKRRDPADRVPAFKMKSDPWSDDETDRFYEALGTWGTDFQMISSLFPPKTRRQIKLKFVREERLDLARVNAALMGRGPPMSVENYALASGQSLDGFKDPRVVEEEMRLENETSRLEIDRKRAEAVEAEQQRRIQMDSRDKDREQREAQKKAHNEARNATRGRKRAGVVWGSGTF